uniref:COX assembly mitochondrial protein n=1 Tax=Haemonchus contortus TaxID=6289 RepID=A0A7I4YDS1_HAECO
PHMSSTDHKERLVTDNLESLKEGEVFVDSETGKKYRVKKTILPHYASSGPHGLGDPDDRTLRRIEADVIIPNRMNAQIEKVECREPYLELVNCMREKGAVKGLKQCRPELDVFNRCKYLKFNDTEFRERMTEQYLQERSEARRTGKTARERKLEEYREWKKEHESS